MITGQFSDYDKNRITVNIYTTVERTIGEDGLYFSSDPITISTTNDDEFNVLIRKQATINLVTDEYIGDVLFAKNARSIKVEILKNDNCIFYGYVSPNTFNQPYSKPLDEFSITCIDYLSTLQYYNYKNTTAQNYDNNIISSGNVTYIEVLNNILDGTVYYDLSKGMDNTTSQDIFSRLTVTEKIFYGDEFDDIMTQEEVLKEILQYLNLHIIQVGRDYYIFDYENIKQANTTWYNGTETVSIEQSTTNLKTDNHAADDTNISIDDVYNQIQVTDNITKVETVIANPLDEDYLTNPYGGKQKYLTEYYGIGYSSTALKNYMATIRGTETTTSKDDKYGFTDYYMEYLQNSNWKFYDANGNDLNTQMETDSSGRYINQHNMAKYVFNNKLTGGIFKFYRKDNANKTQDDSVSNNFNTKTAMYISVNGNELNTDSTSTPTADEIYAHIPTVEYVSNQGGGSYSPIDEDTTNYLVFSGKMVLQPIVWETGLSHAQRQSCYNSVLQGNDPMQSVTDAKAPFYDSTEIVLDNLNFNVAKSAQNDHGKYYSRRFYGYKYQTDKNPLSTLSTYTGIQPLDNTDFEKTRGLKFKYAKYGDSNYGSVDKFKKLPVLECELIIGDKRLVEYNIQEDGTSEFGWFTDSNLPQVTIDGESVTLSTFSLGVNPAIDDYIVGQEYSLQNTIDETFGIENGVEGTAIPIKKSDNLSGKIQFRILGPINTVWNEVTKRHHSFWRRHKWYENDKPILCHVQNIIISDFECKIYSNNGGLTNTNDNDLIYVSAETSDYVDKKDDIEFNIVTQLTSSEALEKGVENTISQNAAIDGNTNQPITSIYNAITNETAKAEEHYVDYYYREYSKPRLKMETTLHNKNEIKWNDLFTSMNRKFFIMAEEYDVRKNNKTLTLKEYD